MNFNLPDTASRVELHTNLNVNNKIAAETLDNIENYSNKDTNEIKSRIEELNKEWDIERVLETNAASVVILSTLLGFTVSKKWFYLSGIAGGFLLQHALQGWCPPVPLFRRLGVRTCSEINYEKEQLKNHGDVSFGTMEK